MAVMRQCEKPSLSARQTNIVTYLNAKSRLYINSTANHFSLLIRRQMFTFTPDQRRQFAADIEGRYSAKTNKTIVLVGLMGSGKTALGKRLAVALRRDFVDSDHLIEEEAGLSVRDIFELSGEAKFRALERTTILRHVTGAPVILSTGGGAFCDPETRAEITEYAISIWLDSTPKNLLRRIGNVSSRPLLTSGDPLDILTALRAQRLADYEQAELHVRTGRHSRRLSMKKILNILEKNGYIERLSDSLSDPEPAHKA